MDEKTVFQPPPTGSLRPGARLNGIYEIERLIAQGGMGEVYKGFNIQTRDPVAIKVILTELSENPEAIALFRREASTLFNLHHDAIVRYFVFSVDPDLRRAYLAMEFVDGPSLSERLTKGPLSLAEVNLLRKRLGSALAAAHRLGVVHRDISSDNFILPGGDVGKTKIIDFGIARSQRPGEETIIGDGFAGKYNWVSPEQLGMAGGVVTAKSDIYSFGLVLAEALRGRRLDMSGTQMEIIEKRKKVPDLSDIEPSLRPLLEAMLQPNPVDRPADMDAVAAWQAAGSLDGAPKPPALENFRGNWPAAFGAFIVLVSLAGTAYVYADDLRAWLSALVGVVSRDVITEPSPTSTPRPPLISASPAPEPTPSPALSPTPAPTSTPSAGGLDPQAFKDQLPPLPSKPFAELPVATVGRPYRAGVPDFSDPGGRGLRLTADPAPPEGLSLEDYGDGTAEIMGSPSRAGVSSFEIVATNHNGLQARIIARIVVADKPPSAEPTRKPVPPPMPSQSRVAIGSATVGIDYLADLPTFTGGDASRGLKLRAEPNPPDGLVFTDAGGGVGRIAGRPLRPGAYAFDVVATDAAGATARMAVSLAVRPAAQPQAASVSPTPEAIEAFVRAYDPGPCFAFQPRASGVESRALEAVGADKAAFSRFDAAYQRAVGNEPQANFKPILAPQCPALDLVKRTVAGGPAPPRIELAHFEIGGAQPLAGTVSGIAGRRLVLLVIGESGSVFHMAAKAAPGGDVASFSEDLGSADAASIGPYQMLLAVVSDRPIVALEGYTDGEIGELAPKLAAEWARAGASAQLELFTLKK